MQNQMRKVATAMMMTPPTTPHAMAPVLVVDGAGFPERVLEPVVMFARV
jgi:hypothetical protein